METQPSPIQKPKTPPMKSVLVSPLYDRIQAEVTSHTAVLNYYGLNPKGDYREEYLREHYNRRVLRAWRMVKEPKGLGVEGWGTLAKLEHQLKLELMLRYLKGAVGLQDQAARVLQEIREWKP